jgi:hypothetical protein
MGGPLNGKTRPVTVVRIKSREELAGDVEQAKRELAGAIRVWLKERDAQQQQLDARDTTLRRTFEALAVDALYLRRFRDLGFVGRVRWFLTGQFPKSQART